LIDKLDPPSTESPFREGIDETNFQSFLQILDLATEELSNGMNGEVLSF